MQFQGRISKIYPTQSGTSANGNQWSRQDFIFEYFEQPTDRYADRVLLGVMNDRIKEYDLHEGDIVICGFAHTTREYQGRCFNDIRLYHFEKVKQVERQEPQPTQGQFFPPNPTLGPGYQNGQTPTAPTPATSQPPQQGNDDLPF